MARGPESGQSRLSKEEHLSQLKQEREQKTQARAQAKDEAKSLKIGQDAWKKEWKAAERNEKFKKSEARKAESREKREKFVQDLKSGAESTWKNVKGLGPKAIDFMKKKAGDGQDMLDSLVADARYVKQELPHKIQDYKEKQDIKKGQKLYEKEFKKADAHMEAKQKFEQNLKREAFKQLHKVAAKAESREQAQQRKEAWDRKVAETKMAWKGKVDSAKEWGAQKVAETMAKGREIKHTHWDVPVNNLKVNRVNNKLLGERTALRSNINKNMSEIDQLLDRINELKDQNRGFSEQLKFLSDSGIDRGRVDAVLGTADLSKKTAWMTQGNTDLKTLFTMRSAS